MIPYYADEAAGIRIYRGDCRVLLPQFAMRADVSITDPPYDDQTHLGSRSGAFETVQGIDFAPIDPSWVAPLLIASTRRWVLAFCALQQLGAYQAAAGDAWVRAGTWHKIDGAPQFTGDRPAQGCDGIAILHQTDRRMEWHGGGGQAHWSYNVCRSDRIHPTQKPEPLITKLVALFTSPGETILDPFIGSGTTLAVAKATGRKAIGVELDERYCERAAKRIEKVAFQQILAF